MRIHRSIDLKINIGIDFKDPLTVEPKKVDPHREAYLRSSRNTNIGIDGFRVTQVPMCVRNELEVIGLAGGSRVSARARDPQSDLQLRCRIAVAISDQELRPFFR